MCVLLALCVLSIDSALTEAIWCVFSILCRSIRNATFIDVVEIVVVVVAVVVVVVVIVVVIVVVVVVVVVVDVVVVVVRDNKHQGRISENC